MGDNVQFHGLTDDNIAKFKPVLLDFVNSYLKKNSDMTTKEWLTEKLGQELPDFAKETIEKYSDEITDSISCLDASIASIDEAYKNGKNAEHCLADKVSENSLGVDINEYGNKLANISKTLDCTNEQVLRTMAAEDGKVRQTFNSDSFIAEQVHIKDFNHYADKEHSSYVAAIQTSELGKKYGKDFFDIAIQDKYTGKILQKYQVKFGEAVSETIEMVKENQFWDQTIIVPAEQVEEVRSAFPCKNITDKIGGINGITAESKPLMMSMLDNYMQDNNSTDIENWNNFGVNSLLKSIAQKAIASGVLTAGLTSGIERTAKIFKGEKIDNSFELDKAILTGDATGIKTAASGALAVCVEKGLIKVLPKKTPISVISSIAAISIDNIRTFHKVATGELTVKEALDEMGRKTVAAVYEMGWGKLANQFTTVALRCVPVVGPYLNILVSSGVIELTSDQLKETVYNGIRKIAPVAKSVIKSIWNSAKNTFASITNKVFNYNWV